MDDAEYFTWIRENNAAILAAVARDPEMPVSACPDWIARDVLPHIAGWYEGWWRSNIACPPEQFDLMTSYQSAPPAPEDPGEWPAAFERAAESFLAFAEGLDFDAPTWAFEQVRPARFWLGRVATETTVHRWDLERELAIPYVLPAARAIAAIDDLLGAFLPLIGRTDSVMGFGAAPSGSLVVAPTDADAHWLASPVDGAVVVRRDADARGEATLSGPASSLVLRLAGRETADAVEGDATAVAEWTALLSAMP